VWNSDGRRDVATRDRIVGDPPAEGKAHRKINRVKRVQRKIREKIYGERRMTSEQVCAQRFILLRRSDLISFFDNLLESKTDNDRYHEK